MKYLNVTMVLPDDLIEILQDFVQGEKITVEIGVSYAVIAEKLISEIIGFKTHTFQVHQ